MKPSPLSGIDLIGYAFAAWVTVSFVRHLAGGHLKADFAIFRGHSVADWVQIIFGDLLACGFLVLVALLSDSFPRSLEFLRFSWLTLLERGSEHHEATNLMVAGAKIPYFGLVFIPLLFMNLPRLALAEEETFRDGTKNWPHAIPRSLGFGLMHMMVGVPLYLGLALSVPGLWFTHQYFKGGIPRSTMAHSVYNMILATLMFVYVASVSFIK